MSSVLRQTGSRWSAVTTVDALDVRKPRVSRPGAKAFAGGVETLCAPRMESLETRLLLSAVKETFMDMNDNPFTVTLSGGGTLEMNTGVLTVHTQGAGSTLTISTRTGGVVLGGIVVDGAGLKSINASKVEIVGDLTMNASPATAITLANINGTITAHGANARGVSIASLKVSGVVGECAWVYDDGWQLEYASECILSADGRINSIVLGAAPPRNYYSADAVDDYVMQSLQITQAGSIGTISSKYDTALSIGNCGADAKGVSVGSINITGDLFHGMIDVSGRINSLTARNMDRSSVTAATIGAITLKGYLRNSPITATAVGAKGVSIGGIKVGGWFVRSTVVASGRINSLAAGRITETSAVTAATVGTITIKEGIDNFTLTLTGADTRGVSLGSLKAGGLLWGCTLNAPDGRINSLAVGDVGASSVTVVTLGTITVKSGLWDTHITITGVDDKGVSIGSLKAGGGLEKSSLNASLGRINSLSAGDILDGSRITAVTVGTITVKGGILGSYITTTGVDSKGVSIGSLKAGGRVTGEIQAGWDEDGGTYRGRINKLTAGSIGEGALSAGSMGTLAVTGYKAEGGRQDGDMIADITLSGLGLAAGKNTLDSAKIAGTLSGTVTIEGNVGSLSMTALWFSAVTISGKSGTITTKSTLDYAPGDSGSIQVQGGGTVRANNKTFKISDDEILYVV